ncbi:type II toxin-antitoxin system VapC family toxin [Pedobacter cryophilus]|uniref:Type II toxin-antitoxin system VapC family toxin n=1 Tax=Pedobacter cryophilus TaxID=2571271 RepID=A0A4U1BZB0_9SPHI|nr:type II toxin-antitoxin system VapC family toxin [Pedobacter cryophilus]TKB95917.1 type II toxin-antitoxin system VapC family toxin [Pedobacter cryophilus]
MDVLIDTHAVIWFITNDSKLPKKAKIIIEDINNNCYVSIASFWEIAIKNSLNRLELNESLEKVFEIIESSGLSILPITTSHILQLSRLEFHHQDPFDRIIIAQGINFNLAILSKDQHFSKYNINLIWDK